MTRKHKQSGQPVPKSKKGKKPMTTTTTDTTQKKPLQASKEFASSIQIPRDKIEVNEKRNARQEYDSPQQSIEDLAADIKMRGQITPVLVTAQPTNSRYPYRLIAGYRRMRAAELLNLETVRAEVFEGDEQSQEFVNLAENVARQNLQHYELATQLVRLRDKYKLSGDKMGKLVGCSKSFANNLMRCEDNLIPDLLKLFHSAQAPSLDKLIKLAALAKDEQEKSWRAFLGVAEPGDNGASTGATPVGSKRPSTNQIGLAMAALTEKVRDQKLSKEDAKLAMSSLRWCAGLQATIPGIYDPREPSEPRAPAEPRKPAKSAE